MQAVREGRLRKQQRIYPLPGAWEAMAAARDLGGTLSHASAAQRWGLDLLSPPEAHHVTVPRRARRVPEDVRLHYADLRPGEVDEGVTVVPRTVLDCARTLPVPESLAIGDSAMRRFLLHPTELPPLLVGLRGPGAPSAALVLRALDSGAADVFESALRARSCSREGSAGSSLSARSATAVASSRRSTWAIPSGGSPWRPRASPGTVIAARCPVRRRPARRCTAEVIRSPRCRAERSLLPYVVAALAG